MKKIVTLLILSMSFLSLQAFSNQGPQGGPPPSFDEMDSNGDGLLQQDELKGPLAEDFDKFDKDGDGALSQEELPPPPQQRQED